MFSLWDENGRPKSRNSALWIVVITRLLELKQLSSCEIRNTSAWNCQKLKWATQISEMSQWGSKTWGWAPRVYNMRTTLWQHCSKCLWKQIRTKTTSLARNKWIWDKIDWAMLLFLALSCQKLKIGKSIPEELLSLTIAFKVSLFSSGDASSKEHTAYCWPVYYVTISDNQAPEPSEVI